jgi:putative FmdB family regulatory protein
MPLYEYQCRACAHEFEALIRPGDTPKCTSCGSEDLEKLLSHLAVSTEQTRSTNFKKARARAKQSKE